MLLNLCSLAAISATLSMATAQCYFANTLGTGNDLQIPSGDQLCVPQGEGTWTFSMYLSAVDVPSGGGGGIGGGYAGGAAFLIYDNACNQIAAYGKPGCGVPYIAQESFLPYVLTVDSINTGLGGGYFSFAYGDGEYSINNNECGCGDMSQGLQGAEGCKCAFPSNGVFGS